LSFRLRVGPRADRQIRAAAQWWTDHRTKAPDAFVDELEAAFALIEELPYAGEAVRHARVSGLRRVLLGRVRYHLYYRVSEDMVAVEVLALWHTSRGTPPRL
jgi:plasmid stabilization system protein ParE